MRPKLISFGQEEFRPSATKISQDFIQIKIEIESYIDLNQ